MGILNFSKPTFGPMKWVNYKESDICGGQGCLRRIFRGMAREGAPFKTRGLASRARKRDSATYDREKTHSSLPGVVMSGTRIVKLSSLHARQLAHWMAVRGPQQHMRSSS